MHQRLIATMFTLLGLAGTPLAQAALLSPDFVVKVELSDPARRYLLERKETVVVSATFADVVGPDGIDLGEARHEAPGDTEFAVRNVKFSPSKLMRVKVEDYDVLVNAFSGRRSSKLNVLECTTVEGPISTLQGKTHKIRCELNRLIPAK